MSKGTPEQHTDQHHELNHDLNHDLKLTSLISRLHTLLGKRIARRTFLIALFLSSLLCCIALGAGRVDLIPWKAGLVFPSLILFSLAAAVFYTLHSRPEFIDELVEIDIRLALKERLVTAVEMHQKRKTTVFTELLFHEITDLLTPVHDKTLVPGAFSRLHALTPVFLLIITVFLFADIPWSTWRAGTAVDEKIQQIGREMEKTAARETREDETEKSREEMKPYRRLKRIAGDIKNQQITETEILDSLAGLMEETGARQSEMANQLEEALNPGGMAKNTGLEPLEKKKLSSQKMQQLTRKLSKMFDGQIPESIQQNLSNLDRNIRLENYLSETMDEVRSVMQQAGKQQGDSESKRLAAGVQGDEGETASQQAPALSSTGKGAASDERASSDKRGNEIPQDGSGRGRGAGDEPGNEVGEVIIYGVGTQKADGTKKSPYELKSGQAPVEKIKGITGKGDQYKTYIRSLAARGTADVREEDILRVYKKELESILEKEDIPINYRDYIKNYFLSIGMGKEEIKNEHVN